MEKLIILLLLLPLATAKLISESDMEYLGAFALPTGDFANSRFGYGGLAVTPYLDDGEETLFIGGHSWDKGVIAQVEIPSGLVKSDGWNDLPQASVLQDFYDIADSDYDGIGSIEYADVYGLLPFNGRLIVGAANWYDASCSQTASHGVSTFDLSDSTDFSGFYTIDAVANARSLGGYMTTIPKDWQDDFGGTALTGNAALSIIGCISSGPAATVFDPDDVGNLDQIPGTTLVYYPLPDYLVSGGVTDENTFTFGSTVKGIAFPSGTDSVLFFGRQTMADGYCYGEGTTDPDLHKKPSPGGTYCYDLCSQSKGGHGYPYVHYVWAYDAHDLLKIKNGDIEPWEVQPYSTWQLDDMDDSGCAGIRSAGFDPDTNRLYIAQSYGESPKIDVYQINIDGPKCIHEADNNLCDGIVETEELMEYLELWKKSQGPELTDLMDAIRLWKQ